MDMRSDKPECASPGRHRWIEASWSRYLHDGNQKREKCYADASVRDADPGERAGCVLVTQR